MSLGYFKGRFFMSGIQPSAHNFLDSKFDKTLSAPRIHGSPAVVHESGENPTETEHGNHLIAHELTHTVQQHSAHPTEAKSVSFGTPSKPNQSSKEAPTTTSTQPKPTVSGASSLNSQEAFHDTNSATAEQIDGLLKRYNSPHAGKGKEFVSICKKNNINPLLMLAVMQQESSFGSTKLKEENQANPFSVHFNEGAKGIKKLRLKDGSLPTLSQSLDVAAKTMNKWSSGSSTPLTTAAPHYSETPTWANSITSHYNNYLKKLNK